MTKKTCDECGKEEDSDYIICECSDCYIKGAQKEKEQGKIEILTKLKSFIRKKGRTNMISIYELEEFITENMPEGLKRELKRGNENDKNKR